ncbi:hypothetical protein M8J76_001571 [Diaphorina citri]|nr:hypothetical protein M8J76_001571 [Diaphorina citri]
MIVPMHSVQYTVELSSQNSVRRRYLGTYNCAGSGDPSPPSHPPAVLHHCHHSLSRNSQPCSNAGPCSGTPPST